MHEMNRSDNAARRWILGGGALATLLTVAGCAEQMAQMREPGFYNPPPASSATDAMARANAEHSLGPLRAPRQILIDLRRNQPQDSGAPVAPVQPPPPGAAAATPMRADAPAGQTGSPVTVATVPVGAASDAPPQDAGTLAISPAAAAANVPSVQSQLIPEAQSFTGTLPCFHSEMRCTAQRITLTLAPNGRWRARAAYLEKTNADGGAQIEQGCWRAVMTAQPRVVIMTSQGNVRADLSVISAGNALQLGSINGQVPNLVYTLSRQPDMDPIDELNGRPAPNCT